MSDIINNLAKVEISEDVLSRIDMQGLANEFKTNFCKLDEFQRTKEKYENRSWWEKTVDFVTFDNTMEKAEQDALVAQGDFLKTTGRLMVLNIAMSKRLEEQQCNILKHQEILELNSKDIATQTTNIQKQQNTLEEQHNELSNLLKNYMELKGLTRDGAQKLIKISQEVCGVKENIEKNFGLFEKNIVDKIQDIYQLNENNKLECEEKINLLSKNNSETEKKITTNIDKLQNKVMEVEKLSNEADVKIGNEVQQLFDYSKKKVRELSETLKEESDSLKKNISEEVIAINKYQNSEFKLIKDKLESSKLTIEDEIASLRNANCEKTKMIETLSQKLTMMETISGKNFQYIKVSLGILSICIIGIIFSIIS